MDQIYSNFKTALKEECDRPLFVAVYTELWIYQDGCCLLYTSYAKALWLHDWLLDQLEYDKTLKWSSTESALTISGFYHIQAGQAASHAAKGLLHTLSHPSCCCTQLLQTGQSSQRCV